MNGSLDFAEEFTEAFDKVSTEHKIIICPPFPLLFKFRNFSHHLGAQNCSYKKSGAFTGEVSPQLLKQLRCQYVIIGHSERRNIQKETDEEIYQKFKLLIELEMTPIICIGEKLSEKQQWEKVLLSQLRYLKRGISNAIIAYEPVWSIGTGETPTLNEIDGRVKFIKHEIGFPCSVVYGGSVNAKNSRDILGLFSVDGVLVGGASLIIDEFMKIIESAP